MKHGGSASAGTIAKVFAIGAVLRGVAFLCAGHLLSARPELVSPLVSYSRLQDGIALQRDGISPYAGDSVHFSPVVISVFSALTCLPQYMMFLLFLLADSATGFLLFKSANLYMRMNKEESTGMDITVLKCYVWNPITIASTAVLSVSVLHNLLLASLVFAFFSGCLISCAVLLSIVTSLCVYPVIIIASLFLRFPTNGERLFTTFTAAAGFLAIALINYVVNDFKWDFLDDTYGFMLRVDDLTPNSGIFWYFFTQVFEHFRSFYISVFQINLLVYVIPLILAVRNDPHLHLIISLLLVSVFSPYPTLNDAAVYLALLPTLDRYWKQPMRFVLLIAATMVTCVVLMPVMWHMWIVNGSGNANFYFAVTIIYNVAQIYLMIDLLFAYFRRETMKVCGDSVTAQTNFMFH